MMRQVRAFDEWLSGDLLTASRADCERFLAELYERSPNTAQMAWRGMRSFFAFVAEEDGSPNPMKLVKAVRVDEPATKVLTADEYQRLRYHLDRQAKRPAWPTSRGSATGRSWACSGIPAVHLHLQRVCVRRRPLVSSQRRVAPVPKPAAAVSPPRSVGEATTIHSASKPRTGVPVTAHPWVVVTVT